MVFLIITSEFNGHHFHHSSNTSKAKNKKHGAKDSVKGVPAHTLTGVCALEKMCNHVQKNITSWLSSDCKVQLSSRT